jgi:hypothetical protein
MESPEDLTPAQLTQALDQSWATRTEGGGADLLTRMRDSLAAIDTSKEQRKLTKEEFLAELARTRA